MDRRRLIILALFFLLVVVGPIALWLVLFPLGSTAQVSGVAISTPRPGPSTPERPIPTPDPRTPPAPTAILLTPSPTSTPIVVTPASTHTPGPTPTSPPADDQAIRQAFAAALQARAASGKLNLEGKKLNIYGIRVYGDWAVIDAYLAEPDGTPVATEGVPVLARRVDQGWSLAFRGDPEYYRWLEALPNELLTPQQRVPLH